MANRTLLDTVNAVLRRARIISGDSGVLTSLTDSARQVWIDVAVQITNEAIDELYSSIPKARPNQQASSTISLTTGTRDYALATDLARLHWPFIDRTNTQYIVEFPEGYDGLLLLDPDQNDTGIPMYGVIRPTDGHLFLDRAPSSTENGRVYTYQYDKDTKLTLSTDNVPFGDPVWRAVVPAIYYLWDRERTGQFDAALFKAQLGRAARLLPQTAMRSSYNPRR